MCSTSLPCVHLQREHGRHRQEEDQDVGRDIECSHGVIHDNEVVAALREFRLPCASDVVGTLKHLFQPFSQHHDSAAEFGNSE